MFSILCDVTEEVTSEELLPPAGQRRNHWLNGDRNEDSPLLGQNPSGFRSIFAAEESAPPRVQQRHKEALFLHAGLRESDLRDLGLRDQDLRDLDLLIGPLRMRQLRIVWKVAMATAGGAQRALAAARRRCCSGDGAACRFALRSVSQADCTAGMKIKSALRGVFLIRQLLLI
ncbi:hypothetical protein FQA47_015469 [Oryzias melastigma]|uniref:Uncharacterized protein n=1 Tax=Oryzias melastigma TaxID=30732 RepID=A0A834FQB6_ORYME|nr:hypothetical protein FQA47_015469 [Oryzias melastigma]